MPLSDEQRDDILLKVHGTVAAWEGKAEKLDELGEAVARIDERTLNQDRRLDRIQSEAKTAGGKVGAATGGGLAVLIAVVKSALGIN